MAPWKKFTASACAVLGLILSCAILPASASSYSTDNSDLWWNPSESGWGLQIIQRADIIFVTLYLYNTDNTPIWYAAVLNANGPTSWSET